MAFPILIHEFFAARLFPARVPLAAAWAASVNEEH